jgi:hypothetical protein
MLAVRLVVPAGPIRNQEAALVHAALFEALVLLVGDGESFECAREGVAAEIGVAYVQWSVVVHGLFDAGEDLGVGDLVPAIFEGEDNSRGSVMVSSRLT